MSNKQSKNNTKIASISSCLIVKNEVKNLPLLVDDLRRFSDEIIMVDTGSTDGTLEWLKENQDDVLKLYEFEWIDDFSAARNFSFSKATQEWIFWCDADDRISEALIKKLCDLKNEISDGLFAEYNAFMMLYKYTDFFTQYRNRLLKKSCNPTWECIVHEAVDCDNMNSFMLPNECEVIHKHRGSYTDRNLYIFEKHINNGYILSNRETFCYAHELIVQNDNDDENKRKEKHKKAQELVMSVLLDPDSWEVLIWEAMADVMADLWMSSKSQANIGIGIINRLEETKRLRADIYYLRAVLYDIIGDKANSLKDCYNAINTVMTGIESHGERLILSKVYPAMSIYNEILDDFTRGRMLDILKLYRSDLKEVDDFLNNIENPIELTPIDINEIDLSKYETMN